MTELEINQIIERNEPEKLGLFLSEVLEKSKTLDRQINATSIGMILIIFIYYLGKINFAGEIQLGPLFITDTKILENIFPLILSFIILRFVILNSHKAEIKKIVRVFTRKYFHYDNSKIDILYTDDLSRILMPVSLYDELTKLSLKTKSGCLASILVLPMPLLSLIPYIILIVWICPNMLNFSGISFFNKVFASITVWIFLLSIYYLIKTMVIAVKESKESQS